MSAGVRLRGVVHTALAVVLGVGAGVGAATWLVDHRDDQVAELASGPRPEDRLGDRLEEAVAAVREDGVYVAADGRYLLDEQGERAVEQAVAASEVPVYVMVWAPDGETGSAAGYLEDQLLAELGPGPAVAFVWTGPESGDVLVLNEDGGYVPDFSSASDFVGDPATTLPTAVAAAADTSFYSRADDDGDYWGGPGGGTAAGAFFGGGIVLVVLSLGWIAGRLSGRRQLLPGRWTWKETPR